MRRLSFCPIALAAIFFASVQASAQTSWLNDQTLQGVVLEYRLKGQDFPPDGVLGRWALLPDRRQVSETQEGRVGSTTLFYNEEGARIRAVDADGRVRDTFGGDGECSTYLIYAKGRCTTVRTSYFKRDQYASTPTVVERSTTCGKGGGGQFTLLLNGQQTSLPVTIFHCTVQVRGRSGFFQYEAKVLSNGLTVYTKFLGIDAAGGLEVTSITTPGKRALHLAGG